MKQESYAKAGVDIDAGEEAVKRIKNKVKSTFNSSVLTGLGTFGALYNLRDLLKKYREPVMVQSIDGVGTKNIIAKMTNRYASLGEDIVGHCSNDVLAMGARPLTFLDYVANDKVRPEVMAELVSGMVKACRENGISLVGGETAEMPGVYLPGEFDIVGSITAVVEKNKIITGDKIKAGDVVMGLASNGLHTNGYSLARKIFFADKKYSAKAKLPGLKKSLGEELLRPHTNYTRPVLAVLDKGIAIKGLAHITGGGFVNNIPRILPKGVGVEIKQGSWPVLSIFKLMQELGKVNEREMYKAFNMGIGMVVVLGKNDKVKLEKVVAGFKGFELYEIGRVIKGKKEVTFK